MSVELEGDINKALAILTDQVNALRTDLNDLRTKYEAHVHSGVTAGGANTGTRTAGGAASALTSDTIVKRHR